MRFTFDDKTGLLTIYESFSEKDMTEEIYTNVRNVVIKNGVKTVDANIFANTQIQTVYISDSVCKIGHKAFQNCTKLKSIRLPHNKEFVTIEENTFRNCKELKEINIPDNIKRISSYAFVVCDKLKYVHIESKATKISTAAFAGCKCLENINLNNESFGVETFQDF